MYWYDVRLRVLCRDKVGSKTVVRMSVVVFSSRRLLEARLPARIPEAGPGRPPFHCADSSSVNAPSILGMEESR